VHSQGGVWFCDQSEQGQLLRRFRAIPHVSNKAQQELLPLRCGDAVTETNRCDTLGQVGQTMFRDTAGGATAIKVCNYSIKIVMLRGPVDSESTGEALKQPQLSLQRLTSEQWRSSQLQQSRVHMIP